MKKTLSRRGVLASTAMLALGLLTFGAHQASADALEDIAKAGSIKVGIFEDSPPLCVPGLRHDRPGL
jgi:polar amino acid transport system substrate-binding protein